MAQIEIKPAVTETKIVEVSPEQVVLTLSREEAEALCAVGQRIGGKSATTRRKHFDSINDALREAGIYDKGDDIPACGSTSRIYFTDL